MSEPKYPYGYARPANGGPQGMGTMLTWDQMMTKKTVYNLHPEVRRRFHALIEYGHSQGVPLGVGTGWRVQPNPPPPGFAKPGNSWHESCPVSPQSATAFAIDTVPNISWDWLGRNCAAFGLRVFTNVNNEPWHAQPIDIPTGRRYATVPPPIGHWDLPGPEPGPAPEEEDVHPTICSRGTGQLDMFATDKNNGHLMHRWWAQGMLEGQWSGWEDLGGILVGPPTAIGSAVEPGRIDIFGVGADGGLWQIVWDANGWSGWFPHGEMP